LTFLVCLCGSVPQYLACGADNQTMMRPGSSIMGQEVGAHGSGSLRVDPHYLSFSRNEPDDQLNLSDYRPGESVMLKLSGIPSGAFFALRVSDGGGILSPQPPTPLIPKCNGQLYSGEPASAGKAVHAILETPCHRSPEVITISLIASPSGFGPFFYTTLRLHLKGSRMPTCPTKPRPPRI